MTPDHIAILFVSACFALSVVAFVDGMLND
jgi:hypothetical protein